MDPGPASPPSSAVAGPSSLWRLAERRSRKAGSANIFSNVNLWQLQRLFRAAGDQDAEQRAQLVWGHGDEAELAQALIGLRNSLMCFPKFIPTLTLTMHTDTMDVNKLL
uniref:Arginine vasopressin-induced protein 1 n=1 Tax=Sander lucioperca TaxID=283035 RepID=A0A8D0A5D9_SANLU